MLCGVLNATGEEQDELGSYCSCLGGQGLWLRLKRCGDGEMGGFEIILEKTPRGLGGEEVEEKRRL